ncbi:purine catabolism protein PucB [Abditibacteriota bacterium]|nr:purine catabolism protein PucB [Abditibacteriota bacterium]
MNLPRVAAVVLAAGSSSRLGQPKQLIEFEGQTLIRRTVGTVIASMVDLVVVTTSVNGIGFEEELEGMKWTRAVVENPQLGQSESVKAGLHAVEARGGFDAILLTPCDLPLLSISHLNELIATYQSGKWDIVASRYGGTLGAPLIVGRELWPELHELRGDVGVRKILPAHLQTTAAVMWEEGKFDIDTPKDIKMLTSRGGS